MSPGSWKSLVKTTGVFSKKDLRKVGLRSTYAQQCLEALWALSYRYLGPQPLELPTRRPQVGMGQDVTPGP